MVARLGDRFALGDAVQILFQLSGEDRWLNGQVVTMQHPGLWVRLADNSLWFVTNTARIRPATAEHGDED